MCVLCVFVCVCVRVFNYLGKNDTWCNMVQRNSHYGLVIFENGAHKSRCWFQVAFLTGYIYLTWIADVYVCRVQGSGPINALGSFPCFFFRQVFISSHTGPRASSSSSIPSVPRFDSRMRLGLHQPRWGYNASVWMDGTLQELKMLGGLDQTHWDVSSTKKMGSLPPKKNHRWLNGYDYGGWNFRRKTLATFGKPWFKIDDANDFTRPTCNGVFWWGN